MKTRHWITGALAFGSGVYDPFLRATIDEQGFRMKLIHLARLKGDERVLEIQGPALAGHHSTIYRVLERTEG